MDPQEPRIKPIISSEPGKNRQDSSECLKTSCFPFKTSFEEETKMEEQATEADPNEVGDNCALVLTKAQFKSGTLFTGQNKCLLSTDQFRDGIESDRLKRMTLAQGECVTSTGLILETAEMAIGEVWGDKHDKLDKLNEQVLSSGQMQCGQLPINEDKVALTRREAHQKKMAEKVDEITNTDIGQLDGQFDTNDNTENDEMMQIDEDCHDLVRLDNSKITNINFASDLPFLLSLSWDDIIYTSLMPLLSIEDIFRIRGTSSGFRSMVDEYFAQLKTLDLTSIGSRFTTKAFKIMTDNNENLRCLNLTGCKCITNELLTPIFQRNFRLHTVDLSECHHLTDGCLQPLTNLCEELKRLVLSNCHWVSRQSMKYLAEKHSELTTLNLTGCWELCDQTLIELLESFRRLEFLSVSNIYSVTDKTMAHIAAYCPRLIALDIRGCWRISDNGVKRVAEYCKELKILNILDCRDVTEASLVRLRKRGVRIDRQVDPLTIRLGGRRGVIPVEALYDEDPLPISLRLQV